MAVASAGQVTSVPGVACLRVKAPAPSASSVVVISVAAALASQSGFDRETFLQAFRGEEAKLEAWHDFASAQRAGITGFLPWVSLVARELGV